MELIEATKELTINRQWAYEGREILESPMQERVFSNEGGGQDIAIN